MDDDDYSDDDDSDLDSSEFNLSTNGYEYGRLLAEAAKKTVAPEYLIVNCFTGFGKVSLESVQKFLASASNL